MNLARWSNPNVMITEIQGEVGKKVTKQKMPS